MQLSSLNDKELLNVANYSLDDLTSTNLERELITRLEGFLDLEKDHTKLESHADELATAAEDALGQFPEEDFLADAIQRLQDLARSCRGTNREEAQSLAEYLEDLQSTISTAAEYARSNFRKINSLN